MPILDKANRLLDRITKNADDYPFLNAAVQYEPERRTEYLKQLEDENNIIQGELIKRRFRGHYTHEQLDEIGYPYVVVNSVVPTESDSPFVLYRIKCSSILYWKRKEATNAFALWNTIAEACFEYLPKGEYEVDSKRDCWLIYVAKQQKKRVLRFGPLLGKVCFPCWEPQSSEDMWFDTHIPNLFNASLVELQTLLERQDSDGQSASVVTSLSSPRDVGGKPSTTPGDAKAKFIAGLSAHHGYSDRRATTFEPVTNNAFAASIGIGNSTCSSWFSHFFGSFADYQRACEDRQRLDFKLKEMNGELREMDLKAALEDLS